MKIHPIPANYNAGFSSFEQLPAFANEYKEEQVGRYWNYYFTKDEFFWPNYEGEGVSCIVDGFSPNLNKELHVGHLRQLALANSINKILCSRPVALLGASLGVLSQSLAELNQWFEFVGYRPDIYYDVLMPWDYVQRRKALMPDKNGQESEVQVWDGPKGEVIVVRNNGVPTYSFYDISFAKQIGPTHYITGIEQKEHFQALGLEDKHLPMGLVLGQDGKKMKSRNNENVSAKEILNEVESRLEETTNKKQLAWNILAWNFLRVSRSKNVNYNPDEWVKTDAPGLYITYTYARIKSTLKETKFEYYDCFEDKEVYDLTQNDINLIGFSEYSHFYINKSLEEFDPAPLANYTHELAKKLGTVYHTEKIKGGRSAHQYAVKNAFDNLECCMRYLGMFSINQV